MRPWLTLSGRKIQLKHQGHVERVLGHSDIKLIQPELEVTSRPLKRRQTKSAPLRRSDDRFVPLQRFAWSDGNKFVLQKVSKSIRNRSPVNFTEPLHGFQSPNPDIDITSRSEDFTSENPHEQFAKDKTLERDKKQDFKQEEERQITVEKKIIVNVIEEPPVSISIPTPPLSCHSNDSSRPSSSSMPRPVRSVVIKLPQTSVLTSPSSTFVTSSPHGTTSRYPNALPSKPIIRLNPKRTK